MFAGFTRVAFTAAFLIDAGGGVGRKKKRRYLIDGKQYELTPSELIHKLDAYKGQDRPEVRRVRRDPHNLDLSIPVYSEPPPIPDVLGGPLGPVYQIMLDQAQSFIHTPPTEEEIAQEIARRAMRERDDEAALMLLLM